MRSASKMFSVTNIEELQIGAYFEKKAAINKNQYFFTERILNVNSINSDIALRLKNT